MRLLKGLWSPTCDDDLSHIGKTRYGLRILVQRRADITTDMRSMSVESRENNENKNAGEMLVLYDGTKELVQAKKDRKYMSQESSGETVVQTASSENDDLRLSSP